MFLKYVTIDKTQYCFSNTCAIGSFVEIFFSAGVDYSIVLENMIHNSNDF